MSPEPTWREPSVWAGVAISSMWLAVLFVGLFGGNILTSNGGGSSAVPVVVAVVPFVFVATIIVAIRGFGATRRELEEERRAREQLQRDIAELRAHVG